MGESDVPSRVSEYPVELDYENYSNLGKKGGDYLKKRPIIITSTNAITIPKKVRYLLDLQPGDCLDYEVMANGSIILARKECCDSPSLRPTCKLHCQAQKRN